MKKTISLLTATALAAGMLAGCGGSANTASSAATNDSAATGVAKISIMMPSYYGTDLQNDGADQVIAAYEAGTNTTVDWRFEADDTYSEKFGLTLMDKDNMPMVIAAKGALAANVIDAAKMGAFWDLSPFLSDSATYPYLSQASEEVLSGLTVDGQVIGIPKSRAIGRYGMGYRTDWAEAVGITEAPKTVQDVYDMLYAFTYNDPDGNGVDDTYGLEMTKYTGPWDIVQTWFGVGNAWVEQDGALVPVHQTAEYKEALEWMRKIYEDGLVRPDWATVDTSEWENGCKKGQCGMFIDTMDGSKRIWNYFTDNDIKSVTDPSVTATMTMVGPIAKDENSEPKTLATSGYNGYFLITKAGAKTEEDVKNCLHFLDTMNNDEMRTLADYGIEGLSYDLNENGNIVIKEGLEPAQYPNSGLNQAMAYLPLLSPTAPQVEKRDSQIAADACQTANEDYAVFNPALGYLANSSVNAEVGTDIAQILDDARTQYICGQLDDAGLEAAFQQWADRGGTRLIEEVNAMYKA